MKSFTKTYQVKASPAAILAALTDADQVARWSGSPAIMTRHSGAAFSLWGGSIHGVNRMVAPDLLVQDWKEEDWDEFSTVTFRLTAKGGFTTVQLTHDGIPDANLASIAAGWDEYYMGPLTDYLEAASP